MDAIEFIRERNRMCAHIRPNVVRVALLTTMEDVVLLVL